MVKILVVDDDEKIVRILKLQLEHNGFDVFEAQNADEALSILEKESNIALVLLDIMLPGIDGITLCKKLKKKYSKLKIIMVSARNQSLDVIKGLDSGADDYVKKPFIFDELLARIRVALRNLAQDEIEENILSYKNLVINANTYEVKRGEKIIELSRTEFDLLYFLVLNNNLVQSREQILDNVWGYSYFGNQNIVDVYIKYLRDKIDKNEAKENKLIHTVRGRGYVLK